ncbi:putative PLP-dependent enzyme possibly involved in cell wall biogenesis [SAR116 cluster alpha proteobacterium HIMB100]|nr:putative PLP-dependent enzyme possibly involved in cell wall biogenesis [SAR116 cluster alpha proteobacterium HIMB100]
MKKMDIPFVNLKRQFQEEEPQLVDIFRSVGRSGIYVLGEAVTEFEKAAAEYCDSKYALGVGNGTDALSMIMFSLGIGRGDEVITAPNSYISSASSISNIVAKPVFADINEDLNIDPACVEGKITNKTKAIMAVHLTGKPAQMHELSVIAEKYNLYLIEDAAQAFGAKYHGKSVGSLGTAGSFSLHPLKNLNVLGDGGLITTNNEALYKKLKKLRNHGLKDRDVSEFWGWNSRLDTLQAEIAHHRLKKIETTTQKFRLIAAKYRANLENLVDTPFDREFEYCVYHNFVIRTAYRNELALHLRERGIETKVHYPIQLHLQPSAAALGYKRGDFPVAEKISEEMLSLPIYPELLDDEVNYIIGSVKDFFSSKA